MTGEVRLRCSVRLEMRSDVARVLRCAQDDSAETGGDARCRSKNGSGGGLGSHRGGRAEARPYTSEEHSQEWLRHLTQVAPIVQFVGVFDPAVADVGAVVHVRDEDVLDAGVGLRLGLEHGLAETDDD
jgi:hypothetical protein